MKCVFFNEVVQEFLHLNEYVQKFRHWFLIPLPGIFLMFYRQRLWGHSTMESMNLPVVNRLCLVGIFSFYTCQLPPPPSGESLRCPERSAKRRRREQKRSWPRMSTMEKGRVTPVDFVVVVVVVVVSSRCCRSCCRCSFCCLFVLNLDTHPWC